MRCVVAGCATFLIPSIASWAGEPTKINLRVLNGHKADTARELLRRYAPLGPEETTAEAWQSWWKENKPYLFFSESGWYRWYIDPLAKKRGIPTKDLRGSLRASERSDGMSTGFSVEPGVRQLFLDDIAMEKTEGLKRVVNQPTRHSGNPVLKGEHPWEMAATSVYGTMLYDETTKLFRLWYLCNAAPPGNGRKWVEVGGYRRVTNCTLLAYATSKDGVTWDKPGLNQLSFEGSTKNNLIDIGIDNPEGVGVLHAAHERDPARRYVAFFWDRRVSPPDDGIGVNEKLAKVPKEPAGLTEKQRQGGMWVAFSPDGIVWKTHGPILPQGSDTTHTILYDPKIKKYVAYGRMGFGRKLGRRHVPRRPCH